MTTFPGNYSFNIYQGDTVSFPVTYKEGPEGSETGVDLGGTTLAGQVRTTPEAPSATATFTVTADADQGANPGLMQVTLAAADTANLTASTYAYDIQITWPDSTVQTILYGTLTVTKEVTR